MTTRERGYGIDDQENELGVNCVALPISLEPGPIPSGAVNISGLAFRRPLDRLVSAVPAMRAIIKAELGTS